MFLSSGIFSHPSGSIAGINAYRGVKGSCVRSRQEKTGAVPSQLMASTSWLSNAMPFLNAHMKYVYSNFESFYGLPVNYRSMFLKMNSLLISGAFSVYALTWSVGNVRQITFGPVYKSGSRWVVNIAPNYGVGGLPNDRFFYYYFQQSTMKYLPANMGFLRSVARNYGCPAYTGPLDHLICTVVRYRSYPNDIMAVSDSIVLQNPVH